MGASYEDEEDAIILYPRSERNKEQKELKERERWAKIKRRPYRVDYKINRGFGTNEFSEYYRTELGARIDAYFRTIGSKPRLTKVMLVKQR